MTDQPSRGGQPGRSGPPGNSNAAKSHNFTVKRELKQLTTDLGGRNNLSAQEQLLVGEVAFLTLQLTAINTWLAKQPQLVDRRKRSLHPVVQQRLALVTTLRTLLSDLGLKRRTKDVQTLESYLAQRANSNGNAAPAAAAVETPAAAADAASAPAGSKEPTP